MTLNNICKNNLKTILTCHKDKSSKLQNKINPNLNLSKTYSVNKYVANHIITYES